MFNHWLFAVLFVLTGVALTCTLIFWHPKSTCEKRRVDEEMKELIIWGGIAFKDWLDVQPRGVSDSDDPFGPQTGRMLQALSKMNDLARQKGWNVNEEDKTTEDTPKK